jgi:hypothetical protein
MAVRAIADQIRRLRVFTLQGYAIFRKMSPGLVLLYDCEMSMVLNVPDRVAVRLRERAAERGESVEDFAVTIFEGSPLLQETDPATTVSDGLLESFLGCGASGDKREQSIHDLRDALSESQIRDSR